MKKYLNNKGFTLIETLVAITILLVAIVGPLTISYRGIAETVYAKNQLVAQYSAQDTAEYIVARKTENEKIGGSTDWLAGLDACKVSVASGLGCSIDTSNDSITQCSASGSTCPFLKFDDTTGIYQYQTGNATPYKRIINIEEDTVNKQAKVSITVSWKTSLYAQEKSYVLRFNMYKGTSVVAAAGPVGGRPDGLACDTSTVTDPLNHPSLLTINGYNNPLNPNTSFPSVHTSYTGGPNNVLYTNGAGVWNTGPAPTDFSLICDSGSGNWVINTQEYTDAGTCHTAPAHLTWILRSSSPYGTYSPGPDILPFGTLPCTNASQMGQEYQTWRSSSATVSV